MHGSDIEKNQYHYYSEYKELTRLLKKRVLVYDSQTDRWLLKNIISGSGNWEKIGTDYEGNPLTLSECLSYHEIEISSLLCMSIYTPFINKGFPKNRSMEDNDHERNGIVICQAGPRFDKPNILDWKYLIIDPIQNVRGYGYGPNNNSIEAQQLNIWAEFYGIPYFPVYEEILSKDVGTADRMYDTVSQSYKNYRYIKLEDYKDVFFDTELYMKKITYLAELFFQEANIRAMGINKKAYCVLIPIGQTSRIISPLQNKFIIKAYLKVLQHNTFHNISDVYFSNFNYDIEFDTVTDFINGVNIHHGIRLSNENLRDPEKLLVRNSEWNGNTYIGNEYFENNLSNSDSSNTACSTFVSYIGNPDINTNILKKIYLF